MPKALDITNKRFGKLIAIKKMPSKNGKTYWLCKCDCGEEKEIQTCHLTSGVTTSCGKCRVNPLFKEEEKECILCKNKFIANNIQRLVPLAYRLCTRLLIVFRRVQLPCGAFF